ncbi:MULTISPECIES: sodium/glutamate symporter [Myroides]|uniref:Sodium/glutamate symporter n=1 Tax=Myroides albus TaxID=2562892 RepID=A0A6I3LLL8_9FLAO|nr:MULTISPECIES: sodium/glutamate symporter [Myroides]MTG98406.1 sodium/glutamate symporter [Myroides albus]MVX36463.1 sodium/glutamate symporter [Myroides sp. LoEW2-1]UVD79682.1 sodium/glutamate symporter [Myroides albus]
MEFGIYETLMLACLVLLLGRFIVHRINFFTKYNIPEPVVGGFLIALISWAIFAIFKIEFTYHKELQESMMYVFFATIGLNADFAKLIKGGKALIVFLVVAAVFIIFQNGLGTALATLLGLDPRFGLIAGSITLTGGHGTAIGWAKDFMASGKPLLGAEEIGMACATFGLIFGGTIGGPLAYRLLKKNNKEELSPEEIRHREDTHEMTDKAFPTEKVTYRSVMLTVTLIAVCLVLGNALSDWNAQYSFKLPTFVWCLFIGVIIRNLLAHMFKLEINNEPVDILGNVGLSIFLACALMSLKLWLIIDLALPILFILLVQVTMMWLFAYYITYRVMGKDYDAIVLSAGHCGFGLGATATAVANIQAVTNRFGPSYKAFLIIPMVGAFFIDILNALILNVFITFL